MQELLDKLFEKVARQFQYGGQKYAATNEKEATDILFDDFGKNWLFGTLAKYVKRYQNLARERDLLKIACYCFILWLKRGYHLGHEGTAEIINTTVEIKSKHFGEFQTRFLDYVKSDSYKFVSLYEKRALNRIYDLLFAFANIDFQQIAEEDIFDIFALSYYVWVTDEKYKEDDEDVNNEEKRKKG